MKGSEDRIRGVGVVLAALGMAVLLAACGGGGSSTAPDPGGGAPPPADAPPADPPPVEPPPADPPPVDPPESGGIDRGGIAVGTITGFGSVIVNGVRYDTDDALIAVGGTPATQADLAVGYKVKVTGSIAPDGASGVAERVDYDADARGRVTVIDAAERLFEVAGQIVRVRNDTVFDGDDFTPAALEGLAVDDLVEVSGFLDATDALVATRIERDAADDVAIIGIVRNLDTAALTFTLGGLTVDYSTATVEGFASGVPLERRPAKVEGSAFGPAGELIATRVANRSDDDDLDDGDFFELEGFITRFASGTDFDVGGRPVTTTAQTTFSDGAADALGLDVKVEVDGTVDGAGVLVAREIDIERAANLLVAARVEAVDVAAGEVTVLGLTIAVTAKTQFEDDAGTGIDAFGLADLAIGDFVEVRGAPDTSGEVDIVASRLERDDEDDDEVELRGFVDAVDVAGGSLEILGITIVSERIGFNAFLGIVQPADLVEIEGVVVGDALIRAIEFGIERRDDD